MNGSWNSEEIRMLKRVFGNCSNKHIAEEYLDRSPKAIERKAAKLNLYKTKKYLRTLGRKV